MDITEFYNEHFSTTKNPSGTDIFERDYNYRELIFFAKEYHKKQLSLCGVVVTYCQCDELANINDSLIGEEICVKCEKPIDRQY